MIDPDVRLRLLTAVSAIVVVALVVWLAFRRDIPGDLRRMAGAWVILVAAVVAHIVASYAGYATILV